jgi:FkbM family methyltransferase
MFVTLSTLMSSFSKRLKIGCIKFFSLVRLVLNPRRFAWCLWMRLHLSELPLDILPSYEHRQLSTLIRCPSAIIDVGFNKGQFASLMLLSYPSVKVYSFDPAHESNDYYAPAMKRKFGNRFFFRHCAVGDREKTAHMHTALSFDNNSLLCPTSVNLGLFPRSASAENVLEVSVVPLSVAEYDYEGTDILLKIDVQGYELSVLHGIEKKLLDKIRWIYIELTDLCLYDGQASADEIIAYISSVGYKHVLNMNINLTKDNKRIIYCDALFERGF